VVETIYSYRDKGAFLLHDFVVMPDHLHLIFTPAETLEKAMQLIKGGYSFRFRKEFRKSHEVWQKSFTDRRIRDFAEYQRYKKYLWMNPVKAGLCERPEDYRFSSASGRFSLDPLPQRLKPEDV